MKKKISISIVVIIAILAIAISIGFYFDLFYKASSQQIEFMNRINAANSIVWYYGDIDPGKEITINYKKVKEFTEETIGDNNGEYAYHAIVIFDFDGKADISDEELLLIKDYCENKYYDLLYYGNAHFDQFIKCGYFQQIDSDELGFTYNASIWKNREIDENYLNPYLLLGNWDEDTEEHFGHRSNHTVWNFVIDFIESLISDAQRD